MSHVFFAAGASTPFAAGPATRAGAPSMRPHRHGALSRLLRSGRGRAGRSRSDETLAALHGGTHERTPAMKIARVSALALVAGLGLAAAAVAGETVRGPELPFGGGTVQTWVRLDGQDRPQQIGVALSEAAVAEPGHDMVFLTVPLPEAAKAAGYDHVSLDWMPHGHPPEALFAAPHFDVHFYLTSEAERKAIDPADPLYLDKAAHEPQRALMPADYMPPPAPEPVPAMGVHWVDVTDPVITGAAPFANIFIYGAWDGEMTFLEPMITQDLLASRKTVKAEVKQPEEVAAPGWYPTRYRVDFDRKSGMHEVVLDGLVRREPKAQTVTLSN